MIYSVLIVFNDSVLSLPSTLYNLRSAILCMDIDSYSYNVANIKAHGDSWVLLWLPVF